MFRKKIKLRNGYTVSVQTNRFVYCIPREDNAEAYRAVEAWFYGRSGFPMSSEPLAFLPASELMKMIEEHGGIVEGELPPLDLSGDEEE